MDDGYLDDFISLNEKGHRQLEMNGLRERVAQVVNWSDRNVVAKERLSRVDLEMILRIGDYCNALMRAVRGGRHVTSQRNGF